MTVDQTLTLIQFVALALPAVAIYMQISYEMRHDRARQPRSSKFGQSLHLSRLALLLLVGSGLLLLVNLLVVLPPTTTGLMYTVGFSIATITIYLAVVLIGLAIMSFGFGVAFQQAALQDDMKIREAIEIVGHQLHDLFFDAKYGEGGERKK